MAEVYWIRLPEHTDVFTQGYVGITKKTALQRYSSHKSKANKSDKNLPVLNAIRKYGDYLEVETLVICSIEYACWLENKLRPNVRIGWNIAEGGEFPTKNNPVSDEARENMRKAQTGRKHSEETKQKIALANSKRVWTEESKEKASKSKTGIKASDEARRKISLASMGRTQSQDSINKTRIGKFYFYMKKNVDVYSIADRLYSYYLEGGTYSKAETVFQMPSGSLYRIFKHFHRGWVPEDDLVWVSEYRGDKEVETNVSPTN